MRKNSAQVVANQFKSCGRAIGFSTHVVKLMVVAVGKARVYTQFFGNFSGAFSQAFLYNFNLLVGALYTQSTNPITTITIK